jgi:NADH:ubiquinone oxidoreductase subunit 2 (subunit N)
MDFLLYINEKINPFQSIAILAIAILILSFFAISKSRTVKICLITMVSLLLALAFFLNIYAYISRGNFSNFLLFFGNVQMVMAGIMIFCALNLLFFIYIYHKDNDNFIKILMIFIFSVICALFVIISRNFLLIFTSLSLFILTVFQLVSAFNSKNDKTGIYVLEYFLRPLITIILFFFAFSLLLGATDFKDFNQILQSEYITNPLTVLSLVVFGVALYQYFFLFPFQGPYIKMLKRSDPAANAAVWFLYFPVGIFMFLKLSSVYNYFTEKSNAYLSVFLIIITFVCLAAGNIGAIKTKSVRRIISFLFLFFIGFFLLNVSMFSAGIITRFLMDLFNFINIFLILFSFMPLYSIFSTIEKQTGTDHIRGIKGLGRINKYAGVNLIIIFIPWTVFIYHIEPFIKYFNADFLQMGALNMALLILIMAALIFLLLNITRIIIQIFKKPAAETVQKAVLPRFLYIYITFYSFIIIVAVVLGILRIINIDVPFTGFMIEEFNF